jgi:hypothetical protein
MGLKTALPFAAAAWLALTAFAATAQEAAPAVTAAPAAAPAPAPVAPAPAPAAPAATYSDSQMAAFAHATVELQASGAQDPAAQTQVIERSGLRVEDYNAMGDAMRADPKLAASLNPYLDEADAERRARITRIPADAGRYTPPTRHAAARSGHVRGSHHRTAHGHGRHHAASPSHGRHAKAGHHAAGRRGHTAAATRHHAGSHAAAHGKARHKRHHG